MVSTLGRREVKEAQFRILTEVDCIISYAVVDYCISKNWNHFIHGVFHVLQ